MKVHVVTLGHNTISGSSNFSAAVDVSGRYIGTCSASTKNSVACYSKCLKCNIKFIT